MLEQKCEEDIINFPMITAIERGLWLQALAERVNVGVEMVYVGCILSPFLEHIPDILLSATTRGIRRPSLDYHTTPLAVFLGWLSHCAIDR